MLFLNILNGDCSEIFISAFLMSLLLNGENIDEIKGTVEAIKSNVDKNFSFCQSSNYRQLWNRW